MIEGPSGERNAIVKNDLYIPQDLVYRRAAQLMEADDCGIDAEHLTMVSTHNHSSPFYSSSSWGVWAFQDVFDVRFFNYMAEQMAAAVERACDELVPVRVGASVGQFDKTHRHSFGPAIADDGTPAGYPHSNVDKDLTVIRFDDISNPGDPQPLANIVNWSGHPEFLEGNDLISADYVGHTERIADRETGALTIWTQGAVGTSEPERSTYHSIHERLEFSHKDYAQSEYAARLLGDEIKDTWEEVESGTPEEPGRFVAFDDDFQVELDDRWYPGPFSHPYPGVSNCRMDKGLAGDPQLPVIGLPDCNGVAGGLEDLTDIIGLPSPGEVDSRSRPRTHHRRLPGARHPGSRELLGALIHRAPGGHRRPPPGSAPRRDLPADLLLRAVVRPVAEHRDPHRPGCRQRAPRLRLGRAVRSAAGQRVGLPEPSQPLSVPAAGERPRVPADAGAGEQPGERLEQRRERGLR